MLIARIAEAAGPAGVKLDGTLGGAAQILAGPTFNISQSLGKLSGGNLFYSFQYFSIPTGDAALYSTSSPGITNVISRVTGGYASTIDGTINLRAAYGSPDFFFINPAGVTFTANAVVNVPAAFNVTTGDYLKFGNGNFYSDPAKQSTLSAAAPEAFGFLGNTRAPVSVMGATLQAGTGGAGNFQIAAGDVTIDGGGALTGIVNTTGNIRVTAVGSASVEVPLSGPFAATDGTVTIRNGGLLLTQGDGVTTGGAIEVNAGSLLIDGGGLAINNLEFQETGLNTLTDAAGVGSDSAGPITVSVGNDAKIVNGGGILSGSFGSGRTGDVLLTAKSLTIDGANSSSLLTGIFTQANSSGSGNPVTVNIAGAASVVNGGVIESDSYGSGNAASITINDTGAVSILDGAAITSSSLGSGNAANIYVTAGSLMIDSGTVAPYYGGGTGLESVPVSSGSGGNIVVNVSGATSLLNFGEIYANADGTTGNAGNISLRSGSLTLNGGTYLLAGGLFAGPYYNEGATGPEFSSGSGGNIVVNVMGAVVLENGDQITSSTHGPGNAGNVSLSAASLTIQKTLPFVQLGNAESQINLPLTNVSAATYGSGNAGRINLQLGSLTITGGDSGYFVGISSANGNPALEAAQGLSAGSGAAGSIVADITGSATLQNGGQISTAAYGTGPAGDVSVKAGSLTIGGGANPSNITSQAYAGSGGQTGQVTLDTGLLQLQSNGSIDISNAATVSAATRIAPTQIKITAQSIDMNGGAITAASTGNVAASGIDVTYANSLRMDPSSISTSSQDADGGPITISGQGPLFIDHSNITTSVVGSSGNGGDIQISVPTIVMNTAAIQANTQAAAASGGTVRIDAQALVPSFEYFVLGGGAVTFDPTATGLNVVQAAAPDGVNGALSVTNPTLDIGTSMLGLIGHPSAPTPLGRGKCGFTRGSSLATTGRGGLPPSARDPLWSDGEPDVAPSHADRGTRDRAVAAFNANAVLGCL